MHDIELRDTSGVPISIGRVRTHVSFEYEVDDLGRVLRETDAHGNETVHVVDVYGRTIRTTDGPAANPSTVHYEYDPADRLVLKREEWRDEIGADRPEVAVVGRYSYDQTGLLLYESQDLNGEEGTEPSGITMT